MRRVLVDDRLLGDVLRGVEPRSVQHREVFTTGYWYVRLCQAVLASGQGSGVISSPFASLPEGLRSPATIAVMELPDTIGLVSLRSLAPLIGSLRRDHSLNILAMEALAAAKYLQADVILSVACPHLQAALTHEGLTARVAR
ncbi:MAG: hypothetical protein ACRDYD_14585 [Acidimicrobiales bacterium]